MTQQERYKITNVEFVPKIHNESDHEETISHTQIATHSTRQLAWTLRKGHVMKKQKKGRGHCYKLKETKGT